MIRYDAIAQFLVKALKVLIYVSAFMPLIIFKEYVSPFHFGKVVILRSIIELMLVGYLLLIWRDRSYLPQPTRLLWAIVAFGVSFSIVSATSVIPYMSFWGTLERMGGLFTFWHYIIFFIVLISVLRTEKEWISLLNTALVIGIISAFYGYLQRTDAAFILGSGGRSRIFGTIGNPALFAGYQLFMFFTAAMLFFRPTASLNEKMLYVAAALFTGIAVLMTAVRGSILGLGVGLIVFALFYTSAYRSRKGKKVLLMLIGGAVVFVALASIFRNADFVRNSGYLRRVTDFSLTNYTIQTRFWAWEAGLKGWSDSPKNIIFGWGPENFNIPFSKYFNPKFYRGIGSETLFDRAHNQFVEVLVTMGLLGFITYMAIYWYAFSIAWEKINDPRMRHYGVGLVAVLISYMIHNAFIFDTSANFYIFFTILGFIAFLKIGEQSLQVQRVKIPTPRFTQQGLWTLAAIFGCVGFIFFAYRINVMPAKANYASTRAILKSWEGNFPETVRLFGVALSYDVPGKYDYRNRFAQYVLEHSSNRTVDEPLASALKLAIEEVDKNVAENKVDYLPYLYVSRAYVNLGKGDPESPYNDKALEYALAAQKLAPDFVRTYYELGQIYLNKKDLGRAAEYFTKAAELNPEVGLSFWYLGIVEMERGNTDYGLSLLERVIFNGSYQPSEGDLNRLMNVYLERKDYAKIEAVLRELIELKPTTAQYRASLATLYAQTGYVDQAIKEAREAAKIDPNFEDDARAFVESLGRQW